MKNKLTFKSFFTICRVTLKKWWNRDPFAQSAIIAFYAIFSLPGLLVLAISFVSIFFNKDNITGHLYNQISSIMGSATAQQIQEMVLGTEQTKNSFIPTLIGLITIIIGASGVFAYLQKALNHIWEVNPKRRKRLIRILRIRIFSFGLILSIGFLLLISFIITTLLSAVSEWILNQWPNFLLFIFYVVNDLISFVVIASLFAMMYKILPDVKIQWRFVRLGAMLTAVLFILGKTAIGFYLGKTDPGSVYGGAGSVVLILLWVSYSSMIFFFGAEFTKAHSDYFQPKPVS